MNLIPKKYFLGDDFFDDFFEPTIKNQMKCDIYEKDGAYNIEVDVPGYDKKDINIDCDNGYLTITISKDEENNDEGKNYIRRERHYGKYSRSFYVGDVDADQIKASFDKGTLTINVPKVEEKPTKKQIEIK